MVPASALELDALHLKVLVAVDLAADAKTGECYPSRRWLAGRAGVSLSTVDRALRKLRDGGYITVRGRTDANGDATTNLYTVVSRQRRGVPHTDDTPFPASSNGALRPDDTGVVPRDALNQSHSEPDPPIHSSSESCTCGKPPECPKDEDCWDEVRNRYQRDAGNVDHPPKWMAKVHHNLHHVEHWTKPAARKPLLGAKS
jgi:hypothetical protein